MPATPRWLLAIPDAIRQLEALDRPGPLTRRDRRAALRRLASPGGDAHADLRGRDDRRPANAPENTAPPPAPDAPRPPVHRARAAFRGEAHAGRDLLAELRQARLTGIRVAVPSEALEARPVVACPRGRVGRARDRIEVRFSGAQDAVGRLFALAQALTHDYEQFEALVEEGDGARRGSGVSE